MLKIRHLHAAYGADDVLHDIDLDVREGEIITLVGANGAGKSTLMKAISGLLPPSRGEIHFRSSRIDGLPVAARLRMGLAHVPEGRQVFGGLSVLENVELGAHVHRGDSVAKSERLREVRALFPALAPFENTPAANLSGGQQQLLAIARGLMSAPRLILLDEPSLGVAPILVQEIFQFIRSLKARGVSVLLAEQNARAALSIADRGYVLENGQVVHSGAANDMLHSKEVADRYLGAGGRSQNLSSSDRLTGAMLRSILDM